jgi:metal-sulfur cluster biosynthetic enzyme
MAATPHPTSALGCAVYPHDPLWNALREVEDPELGISLVDLGLVVALSHTGGRAEVRLTYTAMGCPATELIEGDIIARLKLVPGVEEVAIEVVWDPVWTKARLTAEARDALQWVGVSV